MTHKNMVRKTAAHRRDLDEMFSRGVTDRARVVKADAAHVEMREKVDPITGLLFYGKNTPNGPLLTAVLIKGYYKKVTDQKAKSERLTLNRFGCSVAARSMV